MTLAEFKSWALEQKSVGKYTDGDFVGECVSLINQYCYRVLNVPAGEWGNAKDWATSKSVLAYFDKVGPAQAGDILVYGTELGKYGHIEIALDGNMSLQQNRGLDGKIKVQARLTKGLIAVLRAKGASKDMITDKDGDILRIIDSEIKLWDFNEVHSGRNDAAEKAAWIGKDFRQIISEGWREAEPRRVERQQALDFYRNVKPTLEARTSELSKALDIKQKEIDRLTAQLSMQSGDTTLLNDFGAVVVRLLARFGIKK